MIPGLGFRVFPLGEVIDADAFWNEEETGIFVDEDGMSYFAKELPLAIPVAPVATDATDVTAISFTANWESVEIANRYFLDVSTSDDFSSFVTGYENLNVGNVTTKSVTGLSSTINYYYRVRAANYSAVSENSNIITQTTPIVGGISGAGIAATGGTESTITVEGIDYRVHEFNSSSTFDLLPIYPFIVDVEYLVVAGGGAGNNGYINDFATTGGGGGAGGLLNGIIPLLNFNTLSVIIGSGGAWVNQETTAASGNNSTFYSLETIGGGGGGKQSRLGGDGGSGGGGAGGNGATPGGIGISGQGNNGADGVNGTRIAGGGGGAIASGASYVGGAGKEVFISGTSAFYAKGGDGGQLNSGNGVQGEANTGNGGKGSQQGNTAVGANGGSGKVIIRYKI